MMGDKSDISWTDATWNPVTGCTKVSPGCAHCYAETWAHRGLGAFKEGRPFTDVRCHPERLDLPLRWRGARKIFVNSLSDLFHEAVPDEFILRVFNVMRQCGVRNLGHTFQILTKREKRMRSICSRLQFDNRGDGRMFLEDRGLTQQGTAISFMPILKRVWLGVSLENQPMAQARIPELFQTPAAVRFVSVEPLLAAVDLTNVLYLDDSLVESEWNALTGEHVVLDSSSVDAVTTAEDGNPKLDWVIVGGESGPGARPCDLMWVRSIREQCRAASVPCFVKQLGRHVRSHYATIEPDCNCREAACPHREVFPEPIYLNLRDYKGGDPSEWPEDLRVQEYPAYLTTEGVR